MRFWNGYRYVEFTEPSEALGSSPPLIFGRKRVRASSVPTSFFMAPAESISVRTPQQTEPDGDPSGPALALASGQESE